MSLYDTHLVTYYDDSMSPFLLRFKNEKTRKRKDGFKYDSPTERIITQRITSERITSERINTERITS